MTAVLHVLYLVFNEGYLASSGDRALRHGLVDEAIRLTRQIHTALPDHAEASGLLALMLLTEARTPARLSADGALVPLETQDRALWRSELIADGTALLEQTLSTGALGPYQLQAAIAAVHDEAPTAEETDWQQILQLYTLHQCLAPGAVIDLHRAVAVAVAMVHGPAAGLEELDRLTTRGRTADRHRTDIVRARFHEWNGDLELAAHCYGRALEATLNAPERDHLQARLDELIRHRST